MPVRVKYQTFERDEAPSVADSRDGADTNIRRASLCACKPLGMTFFFVTIFSVLKLVYRSTQNQQSTSLRIARNLSPPPNESVRGRALARHCSRNRHYPLIQSRCELSN